MAKRNKMSIEYLRQRQEELNHLIVYRRPEVAQKIKDARELGDISENAEYDAALDEQGDLEARIAELSEMLKYADVIESAEDEEAVQLSNKVKVLDIKFNEELTFQLVGSIEANSGQFRISDESPLGQALLGRHVGDVVSVETPVGIAEYKILAIDKN